MERGHVLLCLPAHNRQHARPRKRYASVPLWGNEWGKPEQKCQSRRTSRLEKPLHGKDFSGTPGGTRTPNLLIRSQSQGVLATLAFRRNPLCPLGFRL